MIQIRFYRKQAGGLLQWSEQIGPFAGIYFVDSDEIYACEGLLVARWLIGKWESVRPPHVGMQWDGWLVESDGSPFLTSGDLNN